MKTTTAENILRVQATLGEGACWDSQRERLLWVDILGKMVHIFDPATGQDQPLATPEHVSLVQPTSHGDLVIGTPNGISRLDPFSGTLQTLVEPEADLPGNRFNDGKVGPDGRLYAGSLAYDGSAGHGNLWRIDHDGRATRLITGVGNSNGLGWSPDQKTFYWTDTKTSCVFAFDFDGEDGSIHNRRVAVEVPTAEGHPDGLTVDAEGCLWTALWKGWGVARWDPRTGRLMEKVSAPCPFVTCPSFGGPRLDTLYFTTAKKGRETMEPATEAEAGDLFAAQPGAVGLPGFTFQG